MAAAGEAPDFESTDLYRIVQRYQSLEEVNTTREAYRFAAKAHADVRRKSGELYIHHPLEVSRILADLHMDVDTLCAALLHDVVEDTDYSKSDIADLKNLGPREAGAITAGKFLEHFTDYPWTWLTICLIKGDNHADHERFFHARKFMQRDLKNKCR